MDAAIVRASRRSQVPMGFGCSPGELDSGGGLFLRVEFFVYLIFCGSWDTL